MAVQAGGVQRGHALGVGPVEGGRARPAGQQPLDLCMHMPYT